MTIDLKLGAISSFFYVSKITTVLTFKIESAIEEWSAIFDIEEVVRGHSRFDIKPIFRVVGKDDPKKVIVLLQPPEGNIKSLLK